MFIISKISPYDGKKHIILLFNKYRISELFYDRFIFGHWKSLNWLERGSLSTGGNLAVSKVGLKISPSENPNI